MIRPAVEVQRIASEADHERIAILIHCDIHARTTAPTCFLVTRITDRIVHLSL